MANLKSLVKDTAIYGLSSIVGRFLNYLLVPIYTAKLAASGGGYGVITNIYAYVALLFVLLTFGMETTFFRFANKEGENPQRVYFTVLMLVGTVGLLFVALVLAFITPISAAIGYSDHPSYVWVMALTVAIDAFQSIPFAYLRYKKRPIKFAALKMLFIVMNIALNLFFFVVLPEINGKPADVGFAFYINLFCTATVMLAFYGELKDAFCFSRGSDSFELSEFSENSKHSEIYNYTEHSGNFHSSFFILHSSLIKRMFAYSWPILVLGIAGILNQTADKILFPYIYKGPDAHAQLGIYGAASKIAMIMAMITQAFRYAYEPFVFGKARDKDNRETYAKAMKYFIIFTLLAFLVVMGYISLLRHIIGRDYWVGLDVVPIVMVAEIMMGIYFNLSFWYKLTDRTIWGAWFSGIGCAVLIVVNVIFVPSYGYMACAWAGVAGYGTAMTLSYLVGQKKYPIDYPLADISRYVVLAAVLFFGMRAGGTVLSVWASVAVNTLLIALFMAYTVHRDFPLSGLPVVGRYFKR
ncbi:lipopolysaccharide biosynthesis protein [Prevotella sp. PCHR]|uniref:Lipopolysaccharide biosynthesis protein n=1 Tax=Xylanibacter caecicola TaxID=2736294 RepID=A0ABX2B184_9BACT|nr:lipopolysaccharide biosynthesis protein [Xylanibacter caecicola]NPE23985.1 lipopolysaccharide biosynthesis protein [Xylanibacter caecicola]